MSPSSLFFFFSWLLDCARYLSSLFSSPICSLKNLSHACSLFLSEFSILRELGVFCSSLEHGRWWWCDVQCSCGLWARRWESCRLPWPWPACFVRYDWVLFFSHLSRLLENAYLVLLMTCVRIFFSLNGVCMPEISRVLQQFWDEYRCVSSGLSIRTHNCSCSRAFRGVSVFVSRL